MTKFGTIASLKEDVFRVLDEYSKNGTEYDLTSGGVGDMDKRFITALNGAICLLDSAVGNEIAQTTIFFAKPSVLAAICDFDVFEGEKSIEAPFLSGAFSFEFMGEGTLLLCDAFGNVIEERQLSSAYGNFEDHRSVIGDDVFKVIFRSDKGVLIRSLRFYDKKSVNGCKDEKFLPDGKRLYCEISPYLNEIVSVKSAEGYDVPCDIFKVCDGAISCDERYEGKYCVSYTEFPESYDESDPPDTPLKLSPSCYEAAVFAVAAAICEREDGELYSRLTYKYREMLANIYPKNNLKRKNSFFAGGIFGRRKRGYSFRG